MALDKKWAKVFLTCLGQLGYQINVKRKLIASLTSYTHSVSHIEDCQCLFNKIAALRYTHDLMQGLKIDLYAIYASLDDKARNILYLRHKKRLEYKDIADCMSIKVRSVYYLYNKAVDTISARLAALGYTDEVLIAGLEGDPLILDGFRANSPQSMQEAGEVC